MPFSFRALRLGLITLLILLGTALSAGWAMHQAKRQAMEDDARRASQQLGRRGPPDWQGPWPGPAKTISSSVPLWGLCRIQR